LLLLLGCVDGKTSTLSDEIEANAEQLLVVLRAKRWDDAANLSLVDQHTFQRFDLSTSDDEQAARAKIARLFQQTYDKIPPGEIFGVDIDPQQQGDLDFARVTYLHGDLDAFSMRKVKGRWYYTYE